MKIVALLWVNNLLCKLRGCMSYGSVNPRVGVLLVTSIIYIFKMSCERTIIHMP